MVYVETTHFNPERVFVETGETSNSCCDGYNHDKNRCNKCDYRFVSCIIPLTETTCGPDSITFTSDVNENSADIQFSSDTLLGLHNPLTFTGLTPTYNVSYIINGQGIKRRNVWSQAALRGRGCAYPFLHEAHEEIIKYSQTSLIRTPVIRAPPSTGQLILSILC